jgi:hypothetical protein
VCRIIIDYPLVWSCTSKRDSSTALMIAIGQTGSKVMNRVERSAKFALTEFSEVRLALVRYL